MALTRSFKETVKARAARDPVFRVALLEIETADPDIPDPLALHRPLLP
jgi:hypothetical protein